MKFDRLLSLVVSVWLVAGLGGFAAAQSAARLGGIITDPSGAVVPDTVVEAVNDASGLVYKTTTNEQGLYSFQALPTGTYSVKMVRQGFRAIVSSVVLHADDRKSVNVTLKIATGQEKMDVVGSATEVPVTDTGAKSDTITSEQMNNLSTVGRSALVLMTILPGVVLNRNCTGT